MKKILHKRGLEENLPVLSESEIAYTTDKQDLYVGTGEENIKIAKEKDLNNLRNDWEDSNIRNVIFVCPGEILRGPQDAIISVPRDAELKAAKALLSTVGEGDLKVRIQKSDNFTDWVDLTGDLMIAAGSHTDGMLYADEPIVIAQATLLRLLVVEAPLDARGLTVDMAIKYN